MFTQFVVRAAAAGATVTLPTEFGDFAALIGGQTGSEATVAWPDSTTYLEPRSGMMSVVLQDHVVSIPGHGLLRIEPIVADAEVSYRQALPGARSNGARHAPNGDGPRHSA